MNLTCENLLRKPGWNHMQVQQRGEDTLQISKHGGQAQAEEHYKEQHGPYLRAWHFYHRLSEHNEGQSSSRCALQVGSETISHTQPHKTLFRKSFS